MILMRCLEVELYNAFTLQQSINDGMLKSKTRTMLL
jgi:hypothetical protein